MVRGLRLGSPLQIWWCDFFSGGWRPDGWRFRTFSATYVGFVLLTYNLQLGFLSNLVKIFPSLATRPLYITGESYAGFWIVSRHFPLVVYYTGSPCFLSAIHHESDFQFSQSSCATCEDCNWKWSLWILCNLFACPSSKNPSARKIIHYFDAFYHKSGNFDWNVSTSCKLWYRSSGLLPWSVSCTKRKNLSVTHRIF